MSLPQINKHALTRSFLKTGGTCLFFAINQRLKSLYRVQVKIFIIYDYN